MKYNDNIIELLSEKSILLLDRGSGIIITKVKDESTEDNYEIYVFKIQILNPKGGILTEREFIKSYWMEI